MLCDVDGIGGTVMRVLVKRADTSWYQEIEELALCWHILAFVS